MAEKPVRQLIAGAESQTEFYPKQLMQNILDGEAGENLYAYLSKFNHINAGYVTSATAARNAIPEIYRKTGFIITYYLNEKPTTEQFIGNKENAGSDNWLDNSYWQLVDGIGEVDSNSITLSQLSKEVIDLLGKGNNNIVNYPDGEDLTEVDACGGNSKQEINILKFADKKYNAANFSGLGRVYLRKNLVEVEESDGTKVTKNVLTQEMISNANTRYIIQYDYDLNREEITIPEGCVLDFQGGSFNNGTINLNSCDLKGNIRFSAIVYNFRDNIVHNIYNNYINDSLNNTLTNNDAVLFIDKTILWKKINNGDDIISLDNKKTLSIVGINKEISKLILETDNVNSTREWFNSSLYGKSFNIKDITIIRKGNLTPSANVGAVFTVPFINAIIKDCEFIQDINTKLCADNYGQGTAMFGVSVPGVLATDDFTISSITNGSSGYYIVSVLETINNNIDLFNSIAIVNTEGKIISYGYAYGPANSIKNAIYIKANNLDISTAYKIKIVKNNSMGSCNIINNIFRNFDCALVGSGKSYKIINNDFFNTTLRGTNNLGGNQKHTIYIQGGDCIISNNRFKGNINSPQISLTVKHNGENNENVDVNHNIFHNCPAIDIHFPVVASQSDGSTLEDIDNYYNDKLPELKYIYPHGYSIIGTIGQFKDNTIKYDYNNPASYNSILVRNYQYFNIDVYDLIDDVKALFNIIGNRFIGPVGGIASESYTTILNISNNIWKAYKDTAENTCSIQFSQGLIFKNNIIDYYAAKNCSINIISNSLINAKYPTIFENNDIRIKRASNHVFTNGLCVKNTISKNNRIEITPINTGINDLCPTDNDDYISIGNTVKFIIDDTSVPNFNDRSFYNAVYLRYTNFTKANKIFKDCVYDPAIWVVYKDSSAGRLNIFNVNASTINTKEEFVKQWNNIRLVELKAKLGLVIDNTEIGFFTGRILRNDNNKISIYPYLAGNYSYYCATLGGTLASIKDTRAVGRIMTWQKTTATFNSESFEYISLQTRGSYTDIDDIPVGICINSNTTHAPVLALATGDKVNCNIALVNGNVWNIGDVIVPNNEGVGNNKSLFIKADSIPENGIYGIMLDSGTVASDTKTYNKGDIILYNNHGYTAMMDNIHTYRDWDGEVSGYNALTSMAWKETGCSATIYGLTAKQYNNGNSSNRPLSPKIGVQYFDTTINKPIWWTGSKWVDATGADV